jgi:hypothetical protein
MAEMAHTIIQQEANPDERMVLFTKEARRYLQRYMPETAASMYDQAAPLEQCWLGLERYWQKQGVGA